MGFKREREQKAEQHSRDARKT